MSNIQDDMFGGINYVPILSISVAEMSALEQLPEKDKDLILPILPIKGWATSLHLENTIKKIEKTINKRRWIASIDTSFLNDNPQFLLTGSYPRPVFYELLSLMDPKDGYLKWYEYILALPSAIPSLIWGDISQIPKQIDNLNSIGRGIVLIITSKTDPYEAQSALSHVSKLKLSNVLVVLELGQINSSTISQNVFISNRIKQFSIAAPAGHYAISASSFPTSFSGYNRSENTIYERMLFNKIKNNCPEINLIYSDRGSARSEKMNGGGGVPSPRIDYPLKDEWKFIREEFEDSSAPAEGEKEALYSKIASEIINSEYWDADLKLWGTQLIELTSKYDKYGINSPARATAARINIHLYLQLHYDVNIDDLDTDDDWID